MYSVLYMDVLWIETKWYLHYVKSVGKGYNVCKYESLSICKHFNIHMKHVILKNDSLQFKTTWDSIHFFSNFNFTWHLFWVHVFTKVYKNMIAESYQIHSPLSSRPISTFTNKTHTYIENREKVLKSCTFPACH